MSTPAPHREVTPARACQSCGAWLTSRNEDDNCWNCGGWTTQRLSEHSRELREDRAALLEELMTG